MADSVIDRTGQQLGNYRLLSHLRQDSTGDVYLGEHIFLKTQAAIKVLPGQLSQKTLEVFLVETRKIAQMKHSNILRILEFGVEGKTPFLVTDYTPNGSLRRRYPRGTLVPPANIVLYIKQVATALQYIHDQGLIHCGVKPENMLIGPQNRILLSDFSPMIDTLDEVSTRNLVDDKEERAEELNYMAPEQLVGKSGPASDQYALGVIVYEWLSGDTPFHRSLNGLLGQHDMPALPPLHARVATISPELERVVMTALEQDPKQRFASVTAFAYALEEILLPAPPLSASLHSGIQTDPNALTGPLYAPSEKDKERKVTRGISISFILVTLIAILAIGGVLLYNAGVLSPPRPITRSITPAQSAQTVTARGTQQAIATFTTQPPKEIYTIVTGGDPFIHDSLDGKSKHLWEQGKTSSANCSFSNGAYHTRVTSGKFYATCLASGSTNLHNFAYEVQMRIVKGDAGGIMFRSKNNTSNFYVFQITNNGICLFSMYKNEKPVRDVQSAPISMNSQKFNRIAVVAYENTFYFYVNSKFVMVGQDSTYVDGVIGVYALNYASVATDVEFRDAKVWKLQG